MKGARIIVATPRSGSWEVVATIVGGVWAVGTASKDNTLGHILYSIYDYAVRQTLGFPVDYSKSLFTKYSEHLEEKKITPAKLDSLTEKVEASIADVHRPIVASKTADHADLFTTERGGPRIRLGVEFNQSSYDYIKRNIVDIDETDNEGVVSSYNINSYSGRLFDFKESGTIAFELEDAARARKNISKITHSLHSNAIERGSRDGAIVLTGRQIKSANGRLKGLRVSGVSRS